MAGEKHSPEVSLPTACAGRAIVSGRPYVVLDRTFQIWIEPSPHAAATRSPLGLNTQAETLSRVLRSDRVLSTSRHMRCPSIRVHLPVSGTHGQS